jgi:hypothetical protein
MLLYFQLLKTKKKDKKAKNIIGQIKTVKEITTILKIL